MAQKTLIYGSLILLLTLGGVGCTGNKGREAHQETTTGTERSGSPWVDPNAKETPAEFPDGGTREMMKWISKHLQYPESARRKGIEGRVVVQFNVERDGKISNPQVVESVDPDLDAEAIRLVNAMPQFIPAKIGDIAVRGQMIVPIKFSLK